MGTTADLEDFPPSDGNSAFCVTFYPKLWKQRTSLAALIMGGAEAGKVRQERSHVSNLTVL